MQLLTKEIFEIDNSKRLVDLLYTSFVNYKSHNFSLSFLIEYDEFKRIMYEFILNIMKKFIENNDIKDKCMVSICDLPKNIKGFFRRTDNFLMINEQVIKDIYNGNIEEFIPIFHELNHFKINYEIQFGIINYDISRILKERLIREVSSDPYNEKGTYKTKKSSNIYTNDDYYKDNYVNYSEEVVANIEAKKNLGMLLQCIASSRGKLDEEVIGFVNEYLSEVLDEENKKYSNHIRDLNNNILFNDNYLDFESAFDFLVKYNSNWLDYPQISVEYFIDEQGVVKKRNTNELILLLNGTENELTKEYINKLIETSEKDINNKERK